MNARHMPIRLAIVRQTYNPYGGAEKFVERVLGALGDDSLAVTLIARKWLGSALGNRRLMRVDPFYLGRLWRDASFSRGVQQLLGRERFDLVQSHERIPGCDIFRAGDGVHAQWLALRARALGRADRIAQRLSPWHYYTLAAERAMFADPRLRAVICISEMVKRDVMSHFAVPPDRLHVIYNGIDLERFHPRLRDTFRAAVRSRQGVPEERIVFLYVGSGFERKGVGRLIEAAAGMRRENVEFWIVGRDKHATRYEKLAQRLGMAGHFKFLGPQQDVLPWLGAADAFVLPTLYEPLSNAALEALACGLPAILTTTCGAAELLAPQTSGLVCDPLDIGQLSRHLDTLAEPGRARAMSPLARACVEHLDLASMAAAMGSLYRQVLEKEAS